MTRSLKLALALVLACATSGGLILAVAWGWELFQRGGAQPDAGSISFDKLLAPFGLLAGLLVPFYITVLFPGTQQPSFQPGRIVVPGEAEVPPKQGVQDSKPAELPHGLGALSEHAATLQSELRATQHRKDQYKTAYTNLRHAYDDLSKLLRHERSVRARLAVFVGMMLCATLTASSHIAATFLAVGMKQLKYPRDRFPSGLADVALPWYVNFLETILVSVFLVAVMLTTYLFYLRISRNRSSFRTAMSIAFAGAFISGLMFLFQINSEVYGLIRQSGFNPSIGAVSFRYDQYLVTQRLLYIPAVAVVASIIVCAGLRVLVRRNWVLEPSTMRQSAT